MSCCRGATTRCEVVFEWYSATPPADAATDPQWTKLVAFSDEIQDEDIEICVQVQKNLRSRAYDRGRYSAAREVGVHHFHSLLHEFCSLSLGLTLKLVGVLVLGSVNTQFAVMNCVLRVNRPQTEDPRRRLHFLRPKTWTQTKNLWGDRMRRLIAAAALILAPAALARPGPTVPHHRPKSIAPFSPAVKVGNMLYLAGQLGTDANNKLVEGGIGPETKQALTNIKKLLEANGSDMQHVVKCTVFMADMKEWPAMNDVYRTMFTAGKFPARSAFGTTGLALGARPRSSASAVVK